MWARGRSREKTVQVFAWQETHELDQVFFHHQSYSVIADSDAEEIVGPSYLFQISDLAKAGSGFDLNDLDTNAIQKTLVYHFLQVPQEAFAEGDFHRLPERTRRISFRFASLVF